MTCLSSDLIPSSSTRSAKEGQKISCGAVTATELSMLASFSVESSQQTFIKTK